MLCGPPARVIGAKASFSAAIARVAGPSCVATGSLRSKRRVGSKVVKRYDTAQTPYQRVLAAGGLPTEQRQALAAQFAALDPIALACDIQRTLDVHILRHRRRRSAIPASEAPRKRAEAYGCGARGHRRVSGAALREGLSRGLRECDG